MQRTGFKPRKMSMRDSYAAKIKSGEKTIERKPRHRLKPMSDKARAKIPARQACAAAVRSRAGNRCEARLTAAGCTGRIDDIHEILARSQGGSITDPENCKGVCRPCHTWINEHYNQARALGLAK